MDATIIEAPRGRPKKDDPEQSSKDPEATHTKKRGQIHHGYKAHVSSDTNAMITDYRLDTANSQQLWNRSKPVSSRRNHSGVTLINAAKSASCGSSTDHLK